jgi:prevent-host-death family protein
MLSVSDLYKHCLGRSELDACRTNGKRVMKSIDASQLRQEIADALDTVAYGGERIAIKRHGKRVAVLVPVDDLELLEAMDDRVDLVLAKKAIKEKGRLPWAQEKKDLGLS